MTTSTLRSQVENKMSEINYSMQKSYNNSKVAISELISMFEVSVDEFWIAYNGIQKQNLLNRFDTSK